ncbi:MAG: nucleoside deaminase [Chitinispirillia bacterium]|nr:nucleoside deaminase [Chitinispirillia bacterium]MCL2241395.1 nucleoside deaminase [Chitinispirillia bacterium]
MDELTQVPNPEYFMGAALREALKAFDEGEVPVGAVIEKDGGIIGRGYNRIEALGDATAHAEIVAITAASAHVGDWRLNGCTLYVTLEPCLMCLGAILQSRVSAVVYGAKDPRLGGVDTFNYRPEAEKSYRAFPQITSGIMEDESRGLLKAFFKKLRE